MTAATPRVPVPPHPHDTDVHRAGAVSSTCAEVIYPAAGVRLHALRTADCPNCGGPIEFKLGASLTSVCSYCRFSVVRTELSVEAIGKVAQLVPTAPILGVGDRGTLDGAGFLVGGRLQLDHGRGPWDEWYIAYDDGRWGWLAKAQGRLYTTQRVPADELPAWDALPPGTRTALPGSDATFTVSERGGSAVVSAEGELPVAVDPQGSGRYVDLEGPDALFATIDYGDGSEPPELYVGRTLAPDALAVAGRRTGPDPEQKVQAARLRCPTCGAPVPITTPDTTERAACGSCRSLLDYDNGQLRYLKQLEQPELQPLIPLGTTGVVAGEEVTVIGFMRRSCPGEYYRYEWSEYLLHTRYGYRWLLESDGHFTYLRPVGSGDVEASGKLARYRGTRFRSFTAGSARVDAVVGEFYWRVEQGDETQTHDYVAPPRMLSCESDGKEINWTLGEYVAGDDLWRGLSLAGEPPSASGVAPAQPNPHANRHRLKIAMGLLAALAVTALILPGSASQPLAQTTLRVPPAPGQQASAEQAVTLTEPFELKRGTTTLQLDLETDINNAWFAVATALINEDTGKVREFFLQTEAWSGPGYSEGSRTVTEYVDRLPAGHYSLRYDVRWGVEGTGIGRTAPRALVRATEGGRSSLACLLAGLLVLLPAVIGVVRRGLFEARRWRESDAGQAVREASE